MENMRAIYKKILFFSVLALFATEHSFAQPATNVQKENVELAEMGTASPVQPEKFSFEGLSREELRQWHFLYQMFIKNPEKQNQLKSLLVKTICWIQTIFCCSPALVATLCSGGLAAILYILAPVSCVFVEIDRNMALREGIIPDDSFRIIPFMSFLYAIPFTIASVFSLHLLLTLYNGESEKRKNIVHEIETEPLKKILTDLITKDWKETKNKLPQEWRERLQKIYDNYFLLKELSNKLVITKYMEKVIPDTVNALRFDLYEKFTEIT